MKAWLLTLALLAALAGAGLWLAGSVRRAGTASSPAAPQEVAGSSDSSLAAPTARRERERSALPRAAQERAEPSPERRSLPSLPLPTTAPPGGSIHVTIASEDGAVEKPWVQASDDLGKPLEPVNRSGWTDVLLAEIAAGSFHFDGLAPGRYWIQASAPAYRKAVRSVEILAAESVELEVALVPALRLAVCVRMPGGEPGSAAGPWQGLFLPVTSSGPLPRWSRAEPWSLARDGEGWSRFVSEAGPDGRIGYLDLERELPVWVSLVQDRWLWTSVLVPEGSTEVVFTLDKEGEPLASLRVRAHDARTGAILTDGMVQLSSDRTMFNASFRGDSSVEFPNLLPGEYGVTVSGRALGWERRLVTLEAGESAEVDLAIGGGVTIEGRLVDAAGAPIGNAPEASFEAMNGLELGRAESGAVDDSFVYLTDAEGRFRIPVEPGLYLLRAHTADSRSPFVAVDVRGGPVTGLEVRTVPPVAVVLRPADTSSGEALFRILDEDGRELEAGRLRAPLPTRLALPAGPMRLLVRPVATGEVLDATFVAREETLVVPVRW